jgi:hypothetical protein
VRVACGGDAGADVEELPDARLRGHRYDVTGVRAGDATGSFGRT